MRVKFITIIIFILSAIQTFPQSGDKKIIYLSMNEVVGLSKTENLSYKSKMLEYDLQKLDELKSLSYFLPSLNYNVGVTNNLELPVFVFMGQKFVVGTKFAFQHSLDISIPLFTGGSRLFNYNIQRSLKKSLQEELKGKEEETVLQSLQVYYSIIFANSLVETTKEAMQVAKVNLEQVKKFYDAGIATELDLQRAKAQYSATLPDYEKASSEKLLSAQRMKYLLNISLQDSIVIADSLNQIDFLKDLKNISLNELKILSKENRSDVKSIANKLDATKEGEKIAIGQFGPSIYFNANVLHQAQLENSHVRWDDYIRSKSLSVSLVWPLFEGGRKVIEYQKAKIQTEQMELLLQMSENQRVLEVEQSYYNYVETIKSMQSLQETMLQAKESLRLSGLLYSEGMSTQLDVLNAQLFYTSSKTNYYREIYNYNISQLNLLYSIGMLERIWE